MYVMSKHRLKRSPPATGRVISTELKQPFSGIYFFCRFLLRLSENNHSRVMFMAKFGKSSEFNPQNGEQVKSSPASNVWSRKGSNLDPKNHQNFITKFEGCGAKFRHKHNLGVVVLA